MSVNTANLPHQLGELVQEMQQRGIHCRQIPKTIIIEARLGNTQHLLSQYTLPIIPHNYSRLLDNKKNFKALLKHVEIPYVLKSQCFPTSELEKAAHYAEHEIGFPVICKPIFGMRMYLVFCGIQNKNEFKHLWEQHFSPLAAGENEVVVEQYFEQATDNRFICFRDGTKAVFRRLKPQVMGDGQSTIAHLITLQNKTYQQTNSPFSLIPSDDTEIQRCLQGQGVTLNTIPKLGEIINLHYATDMDKGGAFDIINEADIHPSYWELVHRVWDIFPKMPFFSLDILSTDLKLPTHPKRTAINESAVGPGMTNFTLPEKNQDLQLVKNLVDILFPGTRLESLMKPTIS